MTFVQTPALALLPGVMDRLAETAPELQVEVVQSETAPALDDLRSQAVDLVVGVEYDPVPVPRQRDVDRRDLMREVVLLALRPEHAAAPKRGPIRLAACEQAAWASGHRGTGLDAVVRNVCNRLGGFEPDIRHRSDDGLVLSALVASGRAVALLPALLATGMPQMTARRLREERLQRTIFSATRVTASEAPAVLAVREALLDTARQVAARQSNLEVLP
jgi:DNA-binding transcriptional LysR family regulator